MTPEELTKALRCQIECEKCPYGLGCRCDVEKMRADAADEIKRLTRLFQSEHAVASALQEKADKLEAENERLKSAKRCLNCVYYKGLAECELIGDCGGTDFYCGWFADKSDPVSHAEREVIMSDSVDTDKAEV